MSEYQAASGRSEEEKEIIGIIYHLFAVDEKGKQLFEYLDKLFIQAGVLPADPTGISAFGGAEVYLGYCEGKKSVIHWLKSQIKAYENMNRPNIIHN